MPLRLMSAPVPSRPAELRACLTVRNEMMRLPACLDHHRKLGLDRFLVVDNASNDGTLEYLRSQPDVHVFSTDESYAASGFGLKWLNTLLDAYCDGHWVLTIDADELFIFPGFEHITLRQFTEYLDATSAGSVLALMLDMYPEREPSPRQAYANAEDLVRSSPFFDAGPFKSYAVAHFPYVQVYGGPRERIFQFSAQAGAVHPPTISKVPLVKWRKGLQYYMSTHALADTTFSRVTAALLHFKFLADFQARVTEESARGEHWNDAYEYRIYMQAMRRGEPLPFVAPSTRPFENSKQLCKLGLTSVTDDYVAFVARENPAAAWSPTVQLGVFASATASAYAR